MDRSRDDKRMVTLRARRQVTLPAEVCEALGLKSGDRLELSVVRDEIHLKTKRAVALRALRAIQRSFAESQAGDEEPWTEGSNARD